MKTLYMAYNHNGTALIKKATTYAQALKESKEYSFATGNKSYVEIYADNKDPRVSVVLRHNSKVVKSGIIRFDAVIDRLIDIHLNIYKSLECRDKLNRGETFKYVDHIQGKRYTVTVKPILNMEY